MNLSGYKRKLLPLGNPQCGGGGGGGCGGGIGNALAGLDKSVGQIIPGGWATLGAVAATVATAGALAPEAFAADGAALGGEAVAADGAALGGEAVAAGEVGSELAGPAVSLVGGADVAAADAQAALAAAADPAAWGETAIQTGDGVAQTVGTEAGTVGSDGAGTVGSELAGPPVTEGSIDVGAADEAAADAAAANTTATTEVAKTAAEAAGTGGLLSGITGSQALMAGLLASSLLGKAQQPATLPQPTGVTAPPSLQTQAGVDPNTILSSLTGVGQGGGQKGVAQTLLTGAGGVDPSTLTLNKKTLLGS